MKREFTHFRALLNKLGPYFDLMCLLLSESPLATLYLIDGESISSLRPRRSQVHCPIDIIIVSLSLVGLPHLSSPG